MYWFITKYTEIWSGGVRRATSQVNNTAALFTIVRCRTFSIYKQNWQLRLCDPCILSGYCCTGFPVHAANHKHWQPILYFKSNHRWSIKLKENLSLPQENGYALTMKVHALTKSSYINIQRIQRTDEASYERERIVEAYYWRPSWRKAKIGQEKGTADGWSETRNEDEVSRAERRKDEIGQNGEHPFSDRITDLSIDRPQLPKPSTSSRILYLSTRTNRFVNQHK